MSVLCRFLRDIHVHTGHFKTMLSLTLYYYEPQPRNVQSLLEKHITQSESERLRKSHCDIKVEESKSTR